MMHGQRNIKSREICQASTTDGGIIHNSSRYYN